MTNSMLNLIFPLMENIEDGKNMQKESLTHVSTNAINIITINKRLFGPTDETTSLMSDEPLMYNSQENSKVTGDVDLGAFCLLISPKTSTLESFHQRNLLFQCALTIASKKTCDSSASNKRKLAVTIISPQRWDDLPKNYVRGMENDSNVIEQALISNRINFVHPKTYEELIIYLMALSSYSDHNRHMFILDDMDYYLNTNEKIFTQNANGPLKEKHDSTNTSILNTEAVDPNSEQYWHRLTKLMAVIQSFLNFENKKPLIHLSPTVDEILNDTGIKDPKCRFLASFAPSLARTLNRTHLLKLYLWVDEIWVLSSDNSSDMGNDKQINHASKLSKRHNMIYSYIDINSIDHKCHFYYDTNKGYYLFKSFNIAKK